LVGSSSSSVDGRRTSSAASPSRLRCPPGQRPDRPVGGHRGQPEPVEDEVGAAVGVPGVVLGAPVQPLAVAGQQPAVVGVVGEPAGQLVELAQRGAGLAQGVVEDVGDRGRPGERQLLVGEPGVGRADHRPGVRRLDAGQQPQQRRLAGAVLADQADPPAGSGGERDAVEHGAVAVDLDEVVGEQSYGHAEPPW
jgi:hypothetical protein